MSSLPPPDPQEKPPQSDPLLQKLRTEGEGLEDRSIRPSETPASPPPADLPAGAPMPPPRPQEKLGCGAGGGGLEDHRMRRHKHLRRRVHWIRPRELRCHRLTTMGKAWGRKVRPLVTPLPPPPPDPQAGAADTTATAGSAEKLGAG
ncbi:Os04g0213300 [Oryza sativa Japonica Group]|uniref:Os04g0213300 protein n=1 Tax=Oryza sativa subsp. japonica TaxID=39947 RepID=A0A0P0W7B6_ORYSJ|nr:Os04g0213300 [Oryza sativa Japonica Group]